MTQFLRYTSPQLQWGSSFSITGSRGSQAANPLAMPAVQGGDIVTVTTGGGWGTGAQSQTGMVVPLVLNSSGPHKLDWGNEEPILAGSSFALIPIVTPP